MTRDPTTAFAWVEETTGGEIIERVEHARWRPQWFLKVALPNGAIGEYVLRGYRNSGVVDSEEGSRRRLRREAGVLAALQGTGVKVPRYFGYESTGDWFLMERVSGSELLTELDDADLQAQIFRLYLDNMALLHRLDPAELDLPEDIFRPRDAEECATWAYCAGERNFRANPGGPDPLYELALSWLSRNRPKSASRLSLCTGDMGANQFFFEDGALRSIFDLEMAYIGDPLQDIGLMRYRNLCYPISGFGAGVRHYFEVAGRPFDEASLNYWTVVGLLGASLNYAPLREHPDPRKPGDMSLIFAMTMRRRGLAEVLHHIHGLTLPPRPSPAPAEDDFSRYFEFLVEEIRQHHWPSAEEKAKHALKTLQSHAEVLRNCNLFGAEITAANLEDLAACLDHRPPDLRSGLNSLVELVAKDPEADFPRRIAALYRIEVRNEHLLEPVIRACGFCPGVPLERIGGSDDLR